MKKRIIITLCALLILSVILCLCSALVMPKRTERELREGRLSGEYYGEAGDHDVLFLGDCEIYESFIPAVLWNEYGITSYVRGTPSQLVWQSYHILEDTLRYETPKIVVYNVQALVNGENKKDEQMNRMTLDGMKWSSVKVKAIFASMTEEESFLDYLFPLLRYHSRITELTTDDFKYAFASPERVSHSGYLMQTDIAPMPDEDIAKINTVRDEEDFFEHELPEETMEYLEKMRLLCEEKGSKLVLVKAPTQSSRYWWYEEWDSKVREYAAENELDYYNFIPDYEEIGIGWTQDTYDEGMHLNVYGAEKYTRYFGNILASEHGLSDRRGDAELDALWGARVEIYKEEKEN